MAFRQLARRTERVQLFWPAPLEPAAVAEADAPAIGEFLLRLGHPLHPGCADGTPEGAARYVTRLFDYHRGDRGFATALEASTVVRDARTDAVVAACLVGGGGASGQEFGVYDVFVDPAYRGGALATNMIHRALSVLADHGIAALHLWRADDSPAVSFYERLGFTPTGAVE